jgi:hypothetical protein
VIESQGRKAHHIRWLNRIAAARNLLLNNAPAMVVAPAAILFFRNERLFAAFFKSFSKRFTHLSFRGILSRSIPF